MSGAVVALAGHGGRAMVTNETRALKAQRALVAYGRKDDSRSWVELTTDLLADLMHLHGAQGFDDCLRVAREHYDTETTPRTRGQS